MFGNDHDDQPISRFVFLSVVFHALLFITYPQWGQLFEGDIPSLERGGTIQVFHVENSPAVQPSPITDPASQTPTPVAEEPQPQPDPTPEPPQEPAIAPPEEVPEEPVIPRPEPTPDPEPEVQEEQVEIEPEPEPVPEPEAPAPMEPEPEPSQSELLTSESGPEMVVEESRPEVQPDPEPLPEPQPRPDPVPEPTPPEPDDRDAAPTGSGAGQQPGADDTAAESTEDGAGEEEQTPPPPPPPASGRSMVAGDGRAPVYPKSAEHDQAEGIVELEIHVDATGQNARVVVGRSSGDPRLDNQAERYIASMWQFQPAAQAYILTLEVEFSMVNEGGSAQFDAQVHFGEVRWAEE